MKFIVTLIIALLSSAAAADTELRFDDGSEVLIKGGRVLFGDDDVSIIYPGSGTTMMVLEHDSREYMELDEDFVGAVSEQMEAAMAEVQAQMEFLPPEQRAMMKAMLEEKMPGRKTQAPEREYRKSGKKQKILTFDCVQGALYADGEKEVEMCVSNPADLGMSKADYESLRAAFAAMSSLVSQFVPGNDTVVDLEMIGGVPVMSNSLGKEQENRLVWLSAEKLDGQRLAIPEDYRKKDPLAGM